MALEKITPEDIKPVPEGEKVVPNILLKVSNGDLKALETVKDKWGFKDEAAALRYELAVLAQAENQVLYVSDKTGQKIGLTPGDQYVVSKKKEGGSAA